MSTSTIPGLTVHDLQELLHQVDPAILLVPARILRRVIKQDRNLAGPGLWVAHRHAYSTETSKLLSIADASELGLENGQSLPERIDLLPVPSWTSLALKPRADTLRDYWRRVFHLGVHAAFHEARQRHHLDELNVRQHIHTIGATAFDEARQVLAREKLLFQVEDNSEVFEEFAAVFLELRYFDPQRLPIYFPALYHPVGLEGEDRGNRVEEILREYVDGPSLYDATRLPGAAETVPFRIEPTFPSWEEPVPVEEEEERPRNQPNEMLYRWRMARADRACARGNNVRAALLRWQATQVAPYGLRGQTRLAAREEIEQLVARLQPILELSDDQASHWRGCLLMLVEPAARTRTWLPHLSWTREARLLYDLQKICIDQERDIYAVSFVEWAFTLGKKPFRRKLPHQGLILQARHLRTALRRLRSVRLRGSVAQALADLIREALQDTEDRLRSTFHPLIQEALQGAGLEPKNTAEEVARGTLLEELLDRVVERGYLTMGDLRDGIARNQLKLPDLTDPLPRGQRSEVGGQRSEPEGDRPRAGAHASEPATPPLLTSDLQPLTRWPLTWLVQVVCGVRNFFLGDPLILANRRFALLLDGVYHRGEIYLRWMQRGTSLAFGTALGRFLTRYLLVPFGGAYFIIAGLEHIIGPLYHHFHPPDPAFPHQASGGGFLVHPYSILATGLFLLGLIYNSSFRRGVLRFLKLGWRAVRGVCYDLPLWLIYLPPVRAVLESRYFSLVYRFLCKPLFWAVLVFLCFRLFGIDLERSLVPALAAFVVMFGLFNTRIGTRIEEASSDGIVHSWEVLTRGILPGLFRLTIFIFQRFLEWVEHILYTVDEILRFRSGESRVALLTKFLLGLVWATVAYVIRFAVNLLIEPQINPIKHFPVVTVSHKLVLGLAPLVAKPLADALQINRSEALAYVVSVAWMIPGVFGFLAWELKENWKLYRATRPATLRPVVVGSHGETILRLLCPGFHSGTIPKQFAGLRRGHERPVQKHRDALQHVENEIAHFVQRELLAFLRTSSPWKEPPRLGPIHLGTNRIAIEFLHPERDSSALLAFELHSGRLLAGWRPGGSAEDPLWVAQLEGARRQVLHDALAGLYKKAGVDIPHEHLAHVLPANTGYDISDEGVLVWRNGSPVLYPFGKGAIWEPRPLEKGAATDLPPLVVAEVVFAKQPVPWDDWVTVWQRGGERENKPLLLPEVRLLPERKG
jgi:hypothetical protein